MSKKSIKNYDDDFTPADSLEIPMDYDVKCKVVTYLLFGGFECFTGTIVTMPFSQAKSLQEEGIVAIL